MSGLLPRVLLSPKEDIFVFIFGFRRGRCARFSSQFPVGRGPVSRVSCPVFRRVFVSSLGLVWFVVSLRWSCRAFSYILAAPRRAVPSLYVSPCYLFFLFCFSG